MNPLERVSSYSGLSQNKEHLNKELDPRFAKDARPMFSTCIGYHEGSHPSGCQKHCVFLVLALRFGAFLQDPGVWEAAVQSNAYMQWMWRGGGGPNCPPNLEQENGYRMSISMGTQDKKLGSPKPETGDFLIGGVAL